MICDQVAASIAILLMTMPVFVASAFMIGSLIFFTTVAASVVALGMMVVGTVTGQFHAALHLLIALELMSFYNQASR